MTPQDDGSVHIRTEGYYEELNSVREEIRQNIITTNETLLQDVIKALEVFTKTDSPELILELSKDTRGEPQRIVKTWVTYKKKL